MVEKKKWRGRTGDIKVMRNRPIGEACAAI